jgi:hypothetical protein
MNWECVQKVDPGVAPDLSLRICSALSISKNNCGFLASHLPLDRASRTISAVGSVGGNLELDTICS